ESLATETPIGHMRPLLRGQPEFLRAWTESWDWGRLILCGGLILVETGTYGAAMGYWRGALQGLFVGINFPLFILLTTVGNALLNAMLAPLLGLNIRFRQSFLAILMSFTIASAILGSFSPLTAFLVWNAPPMASDFQLSGDTYSFIKMTHVTIIAFAGIVANLRLVQLLQELSGSAKIARRVLFAWLAGNLFLGSQLCWILRPFVGLPSLPVEFLRASAFRGNFYENVFHTLMGLLNLD